MQEERTISLCLKDVGILAEDTMTKDGKIRQLVWKPSAHLAKRKGSTSWFWVGKKSYVKDKQECCADSAISFHPTKDPADMIKMWKKIIGVGPFSDSLEDKYLKRVSTYYLRSKI